MSQEHSAEAVAEPAESVRGKARNRFIRWFFIVGAAAPLILIAIAEAPIRFTHPTNPAWVWLVFPTWILFLDAEHWGTILFAGLEAMAFNGVWYAIIGFVAWYLLEGLRKLWALTTRK